MQGKAECPIRDVELKRKVDALKVAAAIGETATLTVDAFSNRNDNGKDKWKAVMASAKKLSKTLFPHTRASFYYRECMKRNVDEGLCVLSAKQMYGKNCVSSCSLSIYHHACGKSFRHLCAKIFGTRINCGKLDRCRRDADAICANQ